MNIRSKVILKFMVSYLQIYLSDNRKKTYRYKGPLINFIYLLHQNLLLLSGRD